MATGQSSDYLTGAFARYKKILFPSPSSNVDSAVATLNVNVLSSDLTLNQQTDESYNITIDSPTATITAQTVYGAMYALETFSQLLLSTGPGTYQTYQSVVNDAPRFAYRAFMIDTARHWQPLSLVKFNIDIMSQNKFNVLHWHLVDDQSFPYQSQVFPKLSGQGSYNAAAQDHVYTIAQVKQVIAYAKARGVRVVPEFDTPGHTRSWGDGYPELLTPCYDRGKPTGDYGPLNPTLNNTFSFLTTFYKELTTVFEDDYFHLGGDEVSFKCWQSNPAVQAWMKQKGWTDYALLEAYYEQSLLDIVGSLDKKYVVWQEIFDNGLKIRPDTIIGVWKGGGWQDELARVTAAGYQAVLSAPWYLNYISYGSDWPTYWKTEPTNFTATDPKQYDLVIGVQACMWAEYVDATDFLSRTWPRLSAVGERMWSPKSTTDLADAEIRMHNHRCRMVARDIPAEPPNGPSYCPKELSFTAPAWAT